ncbi:hypothetical protein [Halorubrum sp. AS12]|uniref:hypothetical protein n=1 Tax=Halorubrum sp. AS12 TaxID=3409687 RepID=UPI003DA7475B
MSSEETFTRLNIDERYDLLERLEAIDPGERVRLTYDSSRSPDDKSVEGRVMDHDEATLCARTDDLKGDVFVDEWNIEAKHYAGLVVKTTGGRSTRRQPRLGELLDVKVIDDE